MTTNNHPITPPPELVQQWVDDFAPMGMLTLVTQAARWGADLELEACCVWVSLQLNCTDQEYLVPHLRAARRPKPPSLKEQALGLLNEGPVSDLLDHEVGIIRRALEALPE